MAKLIKANRVANVKDEFIDQYLSDGYDLVDEKGNVLKLATGGRTISLSDYNKVLEENKALKAEIEVLKSSVADKVIAVKSKKSE